MGAVHASVLGPPVAVFLLEKLLHLHRARPHARHGLTCGECPYDKTAHCKDSCMEEKTFLTRGCQETSWLCPVQAS